MFTPISPWVCVLVAKLGKLKQRLLRGANNHEHECFLGQW